MTWIEIVERLEKERAAAGMPMNKLAQRTRIPESTLWYWATGAQHARELAEGPDGDRCGRPIEGPNVARLEKALNVFGLSLSLRRPAPRLLTWEEITSAPVGFGWLEEDLPGEADDGETYQDAHTFDPCVYTWRPDRLPSPLRIMSAELGEYLKPFEDLYNREGGYRIWSGNAKARGEEGSQMGKGSLIWKENDPPERLKDVPRLRVRKGDAERLYNLFAALSAIVYAQEDEEFRRRVKAVPNGWRDLRMIRVKFERLMDDLMWTVPLEKLIGLKRDMPRCRFDVRFGPVASKPQGPHEMIVDREDLRALIRSAHEERCRICMADGSKCGRCDLGRALDRLCLQDRGGKSWGLTEIEHDGG